LARDGLSHAPASAPGIAWAYSNTNYEILGMLIEQVTGPSLSALGKTSRFVGLA
jgi:CubicO group peptidase (beta-lactamase class C family)